MKHLPPNPYFARAMVRESDMFFGRTDLLRHIYEIVSHRHSVSLVGPRCIGKSSLLWYASLKHVQARFPFDLSRHIFVLLDLRGYLTKTSADFFHSVSRSIIAQGAKMNLDLRSEGAGEDEFSNLLDQIADQGFFLVLLLDAFDKVTRNRYFDLEFFEFLRSHASMGLVSYVTASIAPLYEVCHREIAGSPFFNIFYTYNLEALTGEEARELASVPARRVGEPFTEEETSLVLTLAGRHPFFIQRICYILYEEKLLQGKIDESFLRSQAYKELFPLFQDIWGQLSEQQQTLLLDEAQQKTKPKRELPELSESMLFRMFIRKTCQGWLSHMTVEGLEDALKKIHNPKELGDTDLRLMKSVTQRIKKHVLPSNFERGMVIREILNEALERLRGKSVSESG